MIGHIGFSYVGFYFYCYYLFLILSGLKICLKDILQRTKVKFFYFLNEQVKCQFAAAQYYFLTLTCINGRPGLYGLRHLLPLCSCMNYGGYAIFEALKSCPISTAVFWEFPMPVQLCP